MFQSDSIADGIAFPPVKPARRLLMVPVKWLMIGAAVCLLAVIGIACPPLLMLGIVASYLSFLGFLLASSLYSKRWLRAFSIGAFVPSFIASLISLPFAVEGRGEFFGVLLIGFAVSVVIGSASAVTQGFLARRDGNVKAPWPVQKWVDSD